MKRRDVVAATLTLPTGLALAGCTGDTTADDQNDDGDSDDPTETTAEPTTTESQYADAYYYHEDTGIVLRDVSGEVDDYSITITGTAKNTTDTDYSYAALTFGLYDDTDAKLGTALANISGLEAGQRWKFDALGTDTDTTSYAIEDVTAY